MYGCECWTIKKAEHQTTDAFELLEKMIESPLDCKEIKPLQPKGNQFWIFIGWTDVEAETPILWPPDAKNQLIGKDPDAGKDWRQEKGTTADEIVGWHHWPDGREFEQAPGVGDGQGSLACGSPWDHKNRTGLSNWTELKKAKVTYSCLTLSNPMDYTVRGILQARILERAATPFFRGSSQTMDWTEVSRIADSFFNIWATREAQLFW